MKNIDIELSRLSRPRRSTRGSELVIACRVPLEARENERERVGMSLLRRCGETRSMWERGRSHRTVRGECDTPSTLPWPQPSTTVSLAQPHLLALRPLQATNARRPSTFDVQPSSCDPLGSGLQFPTTSSSSLMFTTSQTSRRNGGTKLF